MAGRSRLGFRVSVVGFMVAGLAWVYTSSQGLHDMWHRILSHKMYLLIHSRKSTPPQKGQLHISMSNSKQ